MSLLSDISRKAGVLAIVTLLGSFCILAQSAAERHTLHALLENGFVRIPAGEFVMGSTEGNADEQPPHRVRITHPFEMSKYEVTQLQWENVMRDPHSRPDVKHKPELNPSHFSGESRPVESVSWDAVQQFIQRLNIRDERYTYRLPTEAEWEYAARAGTDKSAGSVADVAWFETNAKGETHPVGLKKPNAWGLYDMLGNVAEWVQDWYGFDYYPDSPRDDPQGFAGTSYKVYRGCSWLSAAKYCRPAYRGFDFPTDGYYFVGFRLVRTPRGR